MRGVIAYLRSKLKACEPCYARYVSLKYFVISLWNLRFCWYDLGHIWRHMYWGAEGSMALNQLQAKLLFYYHKLEKGLCMPGPVRLFGVDVAPRVCALIEAWETAGHSCRDPIFLGAIGTLRAYAQHIQTFNLDASGHVLPTVLAFLSQRDLPVCAHGSPRDMYRGQPAVNYQDFRELSLQRRSYRDFDAHNVPVGLVEQALQLAQLSPSACNRQPCRLYLISDALLKRQLLDLQNGNSGFGDKAPALLVVTADMRGYFGALERHQPYIDGGLFSMSLLYALQVQGLVTCCLNWCVSPATDQQGHRLLNLSDSERIIMFIAVGFPPVHAQVPDSPRKAIDQILVVR